MEKINNTNVIKVGKWLVVLAFAAGSILTGTMAYAAQNGQPFKAIVDAIDN